MSTWRRCRSPKTTTWSRHSRGIEPAVSFEVTSVESRSTLDDKVTIPAGVPLSVEMAARAVGMSVKRARRLMATPAFQAEFDAAVRAYRACMEPANLAAAAEIRDDKTMGPKARLQAIDRIRGPRPVAGVQVNVQQNNGGRTTILPGYVVNLTGRPIGEQEAKVIEHKAEAPIAPPRESPVGDQARDLAAERAEASAFKVRPE